MKNFSVLFLMLVILAPFENIDAVCQKCERVRAENAEKAKDQDWVFYEDWLSKDKNTAETDVKADKSNETKNKEL